MKVAIVGGREFDDYELVKSTLDRFKSIKLIVSGGAKGADSLGEQYAKENNIETLIHYPDWNEHGKMACFVRNSDIVRDADLVIAFWDGESRGTRDTIGKTHKGYKTIMIVRYRKKQ